MFDYIDLNVKECNFKKPPLAQYLKMAYSNLEMQQGHRQKAKGRRGKFLDLEVMVLRQQRERMRASFTEVSGKLPC